MQRVKLNEKYLRVKLSHFRHRYEAIIFRRRFLQRSNSTEICSHKSRMRNTMLNNLQRWGYRTYTARVPLVALAARTATIRVIHNVYSKNGVKLLVKLQTVRLRGSVPRPQFSGFCPPSSLAAHQVLCSWTSPGTSIPRLSDLALQPLKI